MARPLDPFRQTPGFAVALDAQGARHHKCIFWRRRIEQALVPKGLCSIFRERPAVEDREICRFVAHGPICSTSAASVQTAARRAEKIRTPPAETGGGTGVYNNPFSYA